MPKRQRAVKLPARPAELGSARIQTPDGAKFDIYFACSRCHRLALWSMPGGECPRCGNNSFLIFGLETLKESPECSNNSTP
jgi:hypothetical protein